MTVWAIGDLHLSFGVPDKKMDVFGPKWEGHAEKIKKNWERVVKPEDLVLIPGDISWAMKTEEAVPDLEWIGALPGTKVMIRGNHDYWWSSLGKVEKILPPSVHAIQNNVFTWNGIEIAGARLWDDEFSFGSFVEYRDNPRANKELADRQADEAERRKIFERELHRLELSLQCFKNPESVKIAMTHYPPVDSEMGSSAASRLLEKYGVRVCVFGHLHNIRSGSLPFGVANGIEYRLASCDYLDFEMLKILPSAG